MRHKHSEARLFAFSAARRVANRTVRPMMPNNLHPQRPPAAGNVLFVALILCLIAGPAFAAEGDDIDWLSMGIGLFGGLALFLFGMEQMTTGLKAAAGEQMKFVLAKLSSNRVTGAITGAFVTAVIQSSSVTTVMVVGFVSAGLMTMMQSIGIIFGANVGTTVTAQIVAFRVTEAALPMITVGFLMTFASKHGKARYYGAMVMGLGLIFLRHDHHGRGDDAAAHPSAVPRSDEGVGEPAAGHPGRRPVHGAGAVLLGDHQPRRGHGGPGLRDP